MAIAIKDYVAKLCPDMMPLQEDGDELSWFNLRLKSSVSFWLDNFVLVMSVQNGGNVDDHYHPTESAIQQAARWIMGRDPADTPPESPRTSAAAPPADSPRTDP